MSEIALTAPADAVDLEGYRQELTAYCYRMLGSPFEAEDAVQETILRAWRKLDKFEARAALKTWLYRIATNICLDMLKSSQRRARPMDLGPATEPLEINLNVPTEVTWIEPIPDARIGSERDPADVVVARESVRLALVAALQRLPARQRAVLILRDVLRWEATDAAELLETSVAAVTSSLQRARASIAANQVDPMEPKAPLTATERVLLDRYVEAFQRYDMKNLAALIRKDATQSMPPFDMWLRGIDDIFTWWLGPGIGCKGSILLPTAGANGSPAFGQYKPSPSGSWDPWALQVLELSEGKIVEFTFFLDTVRLFPLFGLPERIEA